jgi:hypothetical protein
MKNAILITIVLFFYVVICSADSMSSTFNPLFFGIVFCIINRKLLKYHFLIGLIGSVLLSYLSFFIGLFGMFGIAYLIDGIVNLLNLKNLDRIVYLIMSGLIASLSMCFLFSKIYHIQNLKKGFYLMLLSYILIPILLYVIIDMFKGVLMFNFFNIYNQIWLLLVGFFLTYTFNRGEIKHEDKL